MFGSVFEVVQPPLSVAVSAEFISKVRSLKDRAGVDQPVWHRLCVLEALRLYALGYRNFFHCIWQDDGDLRVFLDKTMVHFRMAVRREARQIMSQKLSLARARSERGGPSRV